jgi:hypothetical protein
MRIKGDSGSVGIGTTAPSERLTISGIGQTSASTYNTTTGLEAALYLNDSTDASNRGGAIVFGAANFKFTAIKGLLTSGVTNGIGDLAFYTRNAVSDTALSERMRILATGNVGIGSTSPLANLQVGDGSALTNYQGATVGIMRPVGSGAWLELEDNSAFGTEFRISQDSNSGIAFNSNGRDIGFRAAGYNNAISASQLVLKSSGNVGIGTTAPGVRLTANGEVAVGVGSKLSFIGLDINSGVTPNYIKIRTTIPAASGNADFTVNIKGFQYGAAQMCDLTIGWHWYLDTFYNPSISSSGAFAPLVRLSSEGGFVCIVLSAPGYWPKLYVESMYSSAYDHDYASGWSWIDENASGSPIVTVPYKSNFGNGFAMDGSGVVSSTNSFRAPIFYDSDNTAYYLDAANTVTSLVVAGSVGIGTTGPAKRLEVYQDNSSTTTTTGILVTNFSLTTNSRAGISFRNFDNYGAAIWSPRTGSTVGHLIFGTNNSGAIDETGVTEKMRISANGNVGIGVTTPTDKFEVAGNIRSTSGGFYTTASGHAVGMQLEGYIADGAYNSYILNNTPNAGSYAALNFGRLTSTLFGFIRSNNNTQAMEIGTAGTPRITVLSDGNVGIGATAIVVSERLSVNGSIRAGTFRDYNVQPGTFYGAESANTVTALTLHQAGISTIMLGSKANDTALYLTNDYGGAGLGNASTSITVSSTGNVGIGTTSPGYKLEVVGSFAATTKSFVIDHPTKSDMKLRYGSLEGPENGVYVRGRLKSNKIQLPDYWAGLVDESTITVNLTPISRYQILWVEDIIDNTVIVGGDNVNCFYTVFAERKDVEKLEVEF